VAEVRAAVTAEVGMVGLAAKEVDSGVVGWVAERVAGRANDTHPQCTSLLPLGN
jgi:hypothetical protein